MERSMLRLTLKERVTKDEIRRTGLQDIVTNIAKLKWKWAVMKRNQETVDELDEGHQLDGEAILKNHQKLDCSCSRQRKMETCG